MKQENLINRLFTSRLWVVNIGVDVFYHAVLDQKVPAVQVDWRPPAGGDTRLAEILVKLRTI